MMCEQTLEQLTPENQPTEARRRILIIDDDREQAECLSHALNLQGFETCMAHSLTRGAEALEQNAAQLVILDIRLPDGDGLDFCSAINDGSATWSTPVIILSGMEGADIVRRARAAGCRFFLRKPYDPNALLLLVQETLRPDRA